MSHFKNLIFYISLVLFSLSYASRSYDQKKSKVAGATLDFDHSIYVLNEIKLFSLLCFLQAFDDQVLLDYLKHYATFLHPNDQQFLQQQ